MKPYLGDKMHIKKVILEQPKVKGLGHFSGPKNIIWQ
jgi:hypothetical protein